MSKHLSYMPKLDGLRAIAAIMVLIAHYLEDLHSSVSFGYGGNGVQIFFTISGFLITYILLKQKHAQNNGILKRSLIKNFMIKRALRLFPVYYLFITILFIISKLFGLWLCNPGCGWYYFTYTQNFLFYFQNFQSNLLNHTWSLAVEEQFYLLWPLLIVFIPTRSELKFIVFVIIFGLLSKYYFFYIDEASGTNKGILLIHLDTLGAGALLAYCFYYNVQIVITLLKKHAEWLFFSSLAITILFTKNHYNEFINSLFLTIMSVCVVFMCSSNKVFKIDFVFNNSILIFLGKISYGIYLYHKPVPFFTNLVLSKVHIVLPSPILFLVYCLVTLSVTIISWYTIEKYFLKLKDKFI